MNKLNAGQKKSVHEFVAVAGATKANAMKYLKTHAWNLQAAVSDYFENPPSQKKTAAAPASTTTTFSVAFAASPVASMSRFSQLQ